MKILHVIADLDLKKGGPVRAVTGLARAQAAAGHDVRLAATDIGWQPMVVAGVTAEIFSCRDRIWRFSWAMLKGMDRLVSTADVIHLHGLWDFPIWAAAASCRRQKKPYVLTLHGMLNPRSVGHFPARKNIYLAVFGRTILSHARRLHLATEKEKTSLPFSSLAAKAFICPFGVDLPPSRPGGSEGFKARFALEAGQPVILSLGRLHPQKRPEMVLDAFKKIRRSAPQARLVFVGDGERGFVDKLKASADRDMPGQVCFTGLLKGSDVSDAYASADIFVSFSPEESLGLSVLEAMSAGKPVIVTRGNGIAGVIEAAEAGYVVSDDSDQMARRLTELLDSAETRARMGANGKLAVQNHFGWERTVEMMNENYGRAIA